MNCSDNEYIEIGKRILDEVNQDMTNQTNLSKYNASMEWVGRRVLIPGGSKLELLLGYHEHVGDIDAVKSLLIFNCFDDVVKAQLARIYEPIRQTECRFFNLKLEYYKLHLRHVA